MARTVGEASLAGRITAGAKTFRRTLTPLQRQIQTVIRVTLGVVLYLQLLLVVKNVVEDAPLDEAIIEATVLVGLVPNGLFVSIAIAYALAAVRMSRFGALVQQANAVESLSHVDTLCVDKTGTLTANQLELDQVLPLEGDEASAPRPGRPHGRQRPRAQQDQRGHRRGRRRRRRATPIDRGALLVQAQVERGGAAGGRLARPPAGGHVLDGRTHLPAAVPRHQRGPVAQHPGARGPPRLAGHARAAGRLQPLDGARATRATTRCCRSDSKPYAIVVLRDLLRPGGGRDADALPARWAWTCASSPATTPRPWPRWHARPVSTLSGGVVSGPELEAMDEPHFEAAVETTAVFGRITPEMKERLVGTLRDQGRYVAMTGDGVNDVLSLKRSNLAIAMGSGTQAARGVADLILIDDGFSRPGLGHR